MELEFALSFGLTLLIFSYILADNILYRLAVSVFVGLTAAFTAVITFQSVIVPYWQPLTDGTATTNDVVTLGVIFVPALILALALLLKPFSSLKSVTNIALAYLVAVGTAVAIVGAITGTLLPLMVDTARIDWSGDPLTIVNGVIIVVGVITALLYFQYVARTDEITGEIQRPRGLQVVASIGKGFIVITLGAIYGGLILTSLTVLTGQLSLFF